MYCSDIERAIARHFEPRRNMIVPNVGYGLNIHECDMLIVSASGYCTEIEIKTSIADLRADLKKEHGHRSKKIKYLYFAIPEELKEKSIELIPERAGLITVKAHTTNVYEPTYCQIVKAPTVNKEARALTVDERIKLGHLASMRIWTLKDHLYRYVKKGN